MEDKQTITFEDHVELGNICKALNRKLLKKSCEIFNSSKNKQEGKKKSFHWKEAENHLSKFRDHMEEIMFIEFQDKATTSIYYGEV